MEYIIEYYYDPHQKLWCAEIRDEDNNVIEYQYAGSETGILTTIKDLKTMYTILRVYKSSFYK